MDAGSAVAEGLSEITTCENVRGAKERDVKTSTAENNVIRFIIRDLVNRLMIWVTAKITNSGNKNI
jgi:hypothetical protein